MKSDDLNKLVPRSLSWKFISEPRSDVSLNQYNGT